MIDLLR